MKKILIIDGNSIMNRAFYGIMNTMMVKETGEYTNAMYGFLSILFKNIDEINPEYIAVAFDSKTASNTRKEIYEGYKKNRHKMPEELREQMPAIKNILTAMNIKIIELPDFEGDDILGTIAKNFSNEELQAIILSGDRDTFQLIEDNIIVRIPKTKNGKTETEVYDKKRINQEFGLEPLDLIELKALMGDSSDEIPGVPGVGEKTGIQLLQKYKNINNIYEALNDPNEKFKPKLRENLENNRDLVEISKKLGEIRLDAEVYKNLEDYKFENWQNEKVIELFKHYKFNRFLTRFELNESPEEKVDIKFVKVKNISEMNLNEECIYFLDKIENNNKENIIKKEIIGLGVLNLKDNIVEYLSNPNIQDLKTIFEEEKIGKIGFDIIEDYVLLREKNIVMKNIEFDIKVAIYTIDSTNVKQNLRDATLEYLGVDLNYYDSEQINLFEITNDKKITTTIWAIYQLYEKTKKLLKTQEKLCYEIEMPLISVLGDMQFFGIKANKEKIEEFGEIVKEKIENLTNEIYKISKQEFNLNSPKQLGKVLFEDMGLPIVKKGKTGYSTDETTLLKIVDKHEIIEKILEYRMYNKLNSTYIEGIIPYINEKTHRIHSNFNQTITATGRISSTEPNLQNIPTHDEFGKNIKKAFQPEEGYIFVDADYSQVELRILASISKDENMINSFLNNEDIHKNVASKVFKIPIDQVTQEQRFRAKAVNFGIVYGISSFGLANQLKISRAEAKKYIDSYLEEFNGVKKYMEEQTEKAKEKGYVETLFGRRRYLPEINSSNFNLREFGKRVAMNAPIQGTAADIMKIAMNKVHEKINELNINAKIILQVHDELLIEVKEEEKEKMIEILKECMENAAKLDVKLKVEATSAKNWYEVK